MSKIDSYFPCPERRRNAKCQTEGQDPHCIHCGESVFNRKDDVRMIHIMKDVFEGTPDKCIIVQQCNAKGVMGAGLAKAIRDRYPQVYDHYRAEFELGLLELGYTSYIEVEENILICNIVGQESYGREKKLYTNYKALRAGLEDVKMMAHDLGLDVVIPFGIGCGLGGGKWSEVVYPMIEYVFKGDLIEHVFQGGDV